MRRLLRKVTLLVLLAVVPTMGAASTCGGAKRGGDGATGAPPAPTAPASGVAQADGAPPPGLYSGTSGGDDCQFSSVSTTPGTGLDLVKVGDTLRLKGEMNVYCQPIPVQFTMVVTVWFLPYLGTTWRKVTAGKLLSPPILMTPVRMVFACQAGVYFLDMQANGISSKGRPFKAGSQTEMATLSKANCAGH